MTNCWPYNTSRWQRLRQVKLTVDLCCECEECSVRGESVIADQVDHIQPVADGGAAFAWDNLRSMSHAHHSRTTYHWQRGERVPVRGVDAATGMPLDPGHWWRA